MATKQHGNLKPCVCEHGKSFHKGCKGACFFSECACPKFEAATVPAPPTRTGEPETVELSDALSRLSDATDYPTGRCGAFSMCEVRCADIALVTERLAFLEAERDRLREQIETMRTTLVRRVDAKSYTDEEEYRRQGVEFALDEFVSLFPPERP